MSDLKTHEAFKDPKCDVSLRSADGVTFAYRRLWLEAASHVFDEMSGPDREGPRKKDADERDIVDLAEEQVSLAKLLVLAHPHSRKPVFREFEDLKRSVLRLCC